MADQLGGKTTTLGLNLLALRCEQVMGVERFVRNVVGSLKLSGKAILNVILPEDVSVSTALGGQFVQNNNILEIKTVSRNSTLFRIIYEMFVLSWRYFSCDMVLSINNFGPILGKLGQKRIVVIHDVWFLSKAYDGSKWNKYYFYILIKIQVLTCFRIITVSEFSKREIIDKLKVDENKIAVVHNCLKKEETQYHLDEANKAGECYKLERYFLLIGSDRGNKNVANTLEAYYEYVGQSTDAIPMVVIGSYSDQYRQEKLKKYNSIVGRKLFFEGFVSRDQYWWLVAHSAGIVFMSLYEGYGIPVIEAKSHGKPVLVSSGTACQELAGELGVVINGAVVNEITNGLTLLAKQAHIHSMKKNSNDTEYVFNCERCAEKLKNVIFD